MEAQSFHIFLAEDNPADVLLVREALNGKHIAYTLHVAKDGEQAIRFIESLDGNPAVPRLDMVLLDIYLPRHDGNEILKRLRSLQHYAQIPVIIITGSEAPFYREEIPQEGLLHYFMKPSSLDGFMQLGSLVGDILARR
ncbi:MAG: response regulator [Nitrosospira sp.]